MEYLKPKWGEHNMLGKTELEDEPEMTLDEVMAIEEEQPIEEETVSLVAQQDEEESPEQL